MSSLAWDFLPRQPWPAGPVRAASLDRGAIAGDHSSVYSNGVSEADVANQASVMCYRITGLTSRSSLGCRRYSRHQLFFVVVG